MFEKLQKHVSGITLSRKVHKTLTLWNKKKTVFLLQILRLPYLRTFLTRGRSFSL